MRVLLALAGLLLLGLSPSFIDWQQSPELRYQFIAYYVVAMVLVYYGLLERG